MHVVLSPGFAPNLRTTSGSSASWLRKGKDWLSTHSLPGGPQLHCKPWNVPATDLYGWGQAQAWRAGEGSGTGAGGLEQILSLASTHPTGPSQGTLQGINGRVRLGSPGGGVVQISQLSESTWAEMSAHRFSVTRGTKSWEQWTGRQLWSSLLRVLLVPVGWDLGRQ